MEARNFDVKAFARELQVLLRRLAEEAMEERAKQPGRTAPLVIR